MSAVPTPWLWLILGTALIVLEMAAPGVFLIWLGIAALVTGFVDLLLAPPWQASLVLFAAASLLAVGAGRALTRRSGRPEPPAPFLSLRGEALVGRTVRLDAPIVGGEGRVQVDDTSWRVLGPDVPAGTPMRIAGLQGTSLVLEHVTAV